MRAACFACLLAAACGGAPSAEFHYLNSNAWRHDHPQGEPGTQASAVWHAPDSDGRLLSVRGEVPTHYHDGREEWVYILEGSGTFWVGPAGAGFVAAADMVDYPIQGGDWFLIPRRTAHGFAGAATVLSIYSPPMPEPADRVQLPPQSISIAPEVSGNSRASSSTVQR